MKREKQAEETQQSSCWVQGNKVYMEFFTIQVRSDPKDIINVQYFHEQCSQNIP